MESLKSQTEKSGSSSKLKISTKNKELLKDEDCEDPNDKSSFELAVTNPEEQNIYNEFSLTNSMTTREKHSQNIFFDLIDFDKLGLFII